MIVLKSVLVIQRISDEALALFDARPDVVYEVLTDTRPEAIAERSAAVDAITIRDAPLPASALASARRLKIISRHGVGYDNIPVAWCTARGIPVTVVGAVNAVAVAEHTLYLMLAAAKLGPAMDQAVRSGDWAARGRRATVELSGKTLLLVGYGRIGRAFGHRARALGMEIAAFDPHVAPEADPAVRFIASLEEALGLADVVSLHLPLTPATRNLIDASALARMRPNAILLNAARGGLVDEAALTAALQAGRLRAAGLDVFAAEPPSTSDALLARDDVVLSPHNAALTAECLQAMGRVTVQNVLAAFDGALDPALVINPQVLDARPDSTLATA